MEVTNLNQLRYKGVLVSRLNKIQLQEAFIELYNHSEMWKEKAQKAENTNIGFMKDMIHLKA